MRNYRNAFVFALMGNLALLGILAAFWRRSAHHKKSERTVQAASSGTATNSGNVSDGSDMVPHEAALAPVQLSPERLQSIGVRMGRVERKTVSEEIRVTGNVVVDETRLAYVQTR